MQSKELPTLHGPVVTLRPFTVADASRVKDLAGDAEVSATVLNIPHPYAEQMAVDWIGTHEPELAECGSVNFAITLSSTAVLIGAIGLSVSPRHDLAELGYWIGKSYWRNGYGTEAARAMVDYGFAQMHLNRIQADYLPRNAASGRIMEKVGMQEEGLMRESIKKHGRYEDRIRCAILKSDWMATEIA